MLLALGWNASGRLLHPSQSASPPSLSQYPVLRPQRVVFHGQQGAIIRGRFFPGRTGATIVLSPGYAQTQDYMLPWVDFLHRAGFSVMTYDMRGTGGSTGEVTLGLLEPQDLSSAITYLFSRPDVDKGKIGALGFSIGGVATILAAAHDRRIRAVVDDSALDDIRHWLALSLFTGLLHPTNPLGLLSVQIARFRLGLDPTAVRPVAAIGRISPRPILIIQGTTDMVVPLREGKANYAAARAPKQLWVVRGAGHGQALSHAGKAYRQHVIAFFSGALNP